MESITDFWCIENPQELDEIIADYYKYQEYMDIIYSHDIYSPEELDEALDIYDYVEINDVYDDCGDPISIGYEIEHKYTTTPTATIATPTATPVAIAESKNTVSYKDISIYVFVFGVPILIFLFCYLRERFSK